LLQKSCHPHRVYMIQVRKQNAEHQRIHSQMGGVVVYPTPHGDFHTAEQQYSCTQQARNPWNEIHPAPICEQYHQKPDEQVEMLFDREAPGVIPKRRVIVLQEEQLTNKSSQ